MTLETTPDCRPDRSQHPCFDAEARHRFGRIHLPVAPKCNVGCNFCNRKFDCMNESRPGVTSEVLTPHQAGIYLDKMIASLPVPLTVVGIAGPGDPFANPDETMATLEMVRRRHPDMLLCVASNGLELPRHVDRLAELQTSHVTVTVNAVDPAIGARVYRFVKTDRRVHRGVPGATLLLERQMAAIEGLAARGVTVKVNTIVMPGVNDHHVQAVAERVKAGASLHNCMALVPVEGTPFGELPEPGESLMADVRAKSSLYLDQMTHCGRCRADAAGLLGQDPNDLIAEALAEAASAPEDASSAAGAARPRVAVASLEGFLVNQHLGAAEQLQIFEPSPAGPGFELVETRPTPLPGSGGRRWSDLGDRLQDCRALICTAAGARPQAALAAKGVRVLVAEGLIDEALAEVYAGRRPRLPARVGAGAGFDADGVGCGGGCRGDSTGCG